MSRIPRTGLLVLGGVVVGMQAAVAYELEHIDLNAIELGGERLAQPRELGAIAHAAGDQRGVQHAEPVEAPTL